MKSARGAPIETAFVHFCHEPKKLVRDHQRLDRLIGVRQTHVLPAVKRAVGILVEHLEESVQDLDFVHRVGLLRAREECIAKRVLSVRVIMRALAETKVSE